LHNGKSIRPEVAVILRASSLSGLTERLARDSSGHNVHVSKCSVFVVISSNFLNI
jgi:hypothetical protein